MKLIIIRSVCFVREKNSDTRVYCLMENSNKFSLGVAMSKAFFS